MATKISTSTVVPLHSILQSLKAGRKCNPKDLESLHITVDRQADLQSFKFNNQLPSSELTEARKFPDTENFRKVFGWLKGAKANASEHPRVAPGSQNLVMSLSIQILKEYCGLVHQRTYANRVFKLELPVGKRRYTLPDLRNPISHSSEFTLDGARICTVYLPQLRGEAGCAVYTREMFCLLAMAKRSCWASPESQSYRVGAIALWNHEQLRVLTATIPRPFLDKLTNLRALDSEDSFKVELSPYFDPTEEEHWEMVNTLLHRFSANGS